MKTFYATVSDYKHARRVETVQAPHLEAAYEIYRAQYKGTSDFLIGVRESSKVITGDWRLDY
jgi:hypothetical protein